MVTLHGDHDSTGRTKEDNTISHIVLLVYGQHILIFLEDESLTFELTDVFSTSFSNSFLTQTESQALVIRVLTYLAW